MKHTTLTSRTLLSLALMGALAGAPSLTQRARADAPDVAALANDRDNDGDRRDNDGDRRDRGGWRGGEVHNKGKRGDRFEGRDQKGPREGYDTGGSRRSRPNGRRDRDNERGLPGFGRRGDAPNRTGFEGREDGRGRADRGGRGRGRTDDNALGRGRVGGVTPNPVVVPQFSGVVTKVKSEAQFDVRIGDKTYNVYLLSPQNRVSVGQIVGINGERVGTNDIRSATLVGPRRR